MSEKIPGLKTPQQRVFGDGFNLTEGVKDQVSIDEFFIQRQDFVIENGGYGWLPQDQRSLRFEFLFDIEMDMKVDLYRDRKVIAMLDYDHETKLADIYVKAKSEDTHTTLLLAHIPFDEAVVIAELFTSTLDNHPQLF